MQLDQNAVDEKCNWIEMQMMKCGNFINLSLLTVDACEVLHGVRRLFKNIKSKDDCVTPCQVNSKK